MAARKRMTDTDRAAAWVCKYNPECFPNGWLIDELRSVLKAVRKDEKRRINAARGRKP
jgi:REP element-mobilizing transposase RayT